MQLQELTDIDRVHWARSGRCEWTLVSFCSSLGTCVCVRHGCRLTLCPRFDLIARSSEADSISKEQFLNKLFRPQVAVAPLAFLCGLNIQH